MAAGEKKMKKFQKKERKERCDKKRKEKYDEKRRKDTISPPEASSKRLRACHPNFLGDDL